MGFLLFGVCGPRIARPSSSFRRHPPGRGAVGPEQLRPSIPPGRTSRACEPCAGRRAGIAQAAVERQRCRAGRSASGFPLPQLSS
ncbi:hypothetical protein F8237_34865 (plasmid) [Bradyrhizobium betae]|uniref:Uncharacterized protein n=1 Tax=Bradyrhizobium betae TaxID=244734 RepID=A0A5P6PHT2_9BRAD|nr:hypothetical protein F8237_34865 [Bradyrhizobium betae]